MSTPSDQGKPEIVLSVKEHDRLLALSETVEKRDPSIAELLQIELDRAAVVDDAALRSDVVRMGSIVTYQIGSGEPSSVKLVFPGQANIDDGAVSILTPIGVALLGLSPGQVMPWRTNSGEVRRLTIIAVDNSAD